MFYVDNLNATISVGAAIPIYGMFATTAKYGDEMYAAGKMIKEGLKETGAKVAKEMVETGVGLYKNVKGHHIHAKAAFKVHVSYDMKKGLSVSQGFMKNNGWSYIDMTTKQRQIFKELASSGRANTLEEHSRIAIEVLQAGGATLTEATGLVNQSIRNLIEQVVSSPTRIPWDVK